MKIICSTILIVLITAGSFGQTPGISLNLSTINCSIFSDSNQIQKLIISNTGTAALNWRIKEQSVVFTKADYADYTLAVNQDRITDSVWITRKSNQSLFNIARESGYTSTSPKNTLWRLKDSATYKTFTLAVNSNPTSVIGDTMMLKLISDNKFFEVVLHSFTGGSNGGGFSYTRIEMLPGWLSFEKTSGTIAAGAKDSVNLFINATGLEGNYSANFGVFSNDPLKPQSVVHINLNTGKVILVNALNNILKNEGFITDTIDLQGTFANSASDTLVYSVTSKTPAVVNAAVKDSNKLIITEVAPGTSVISVKATNKAGKSAVCNFNFRVNAVPVLTNPLAGIIANAGFALKNIDLTYVFTDTDISDVLTYSAISSNTGVVTVGVAGKTLTISELATGSSNIIITASDGYSSVNDTFIFRVNAVPVVANPIPDVRINTGFGSRIIDLTGVFTDGDVADILTYSAFSSNSGAVTVSVSDTLLTINEVATGPSIITVTASDGNADVTDTFTFKVNAFPIVAHPIADVLIKEGFVSDTLDLLNVFTDSDITDVLTFSGTIISDTGLVNISISNNKLIISESGIGNSTIIITASDGIASVSDTFTFSVFKNSIPVVANPIPDNMLNAGFVSDTIDLTNVFSDADVKDKLTYTALSSNMGVVSVASTDKKLIVSDIAAGSSTITVTATDGMAAIKDTFNFRVNAIPIIAHPIADTVVRIGFSSDTIDVTHVFADTDGDILAFSATSRNRSVIDVSADNGFIIITEMGPGNSIIVVTASDGNGGAVSDSFNYTVTNEEFVKNVSVASFGIYPNPVTRFLYIKSNNIIKGEITIELLNMKGQVVINRKTLKIGNMVTLDLYGLEKGSYILKLGTENESISTRQVIIK